MNSRHSDLIAIANADLAKKLTNGRKKSIAQDGKTKPANGNGAAATVSFISEQDIDTVESTVETTVQTAQARDFRHDVWRAVFALNLFRYGLGLTLLVLITASAIDSSWNVFTTLSHPKLFFFATLTLLASAIVFSYFSKRRNIDFDIAISMQLSLDVILAGLLTHATGSVDSNLIILYVVVVATGSVVLPKKQALALASGAIIVLFAEHFFSVFVSQHQVTPDYSLLATYGLVLMGFSLMIAYLAERIRTAELKSYVPGTESIEEYLVREETNALRNALTSTNGNKTEAAKLLGMSFRSFRYKLTKYNIQ